MTKKALIIVGVLLAILAASLFFLRSKLSNPRPSVVAGAEAEADALAAAMQGAVDTNAWNRTEVVRWERAARVIQDSKTLSPTGSGTLCRWS